MDNTGMILLLILVFLVFEMLIFLQVFEQRIKDFITVYLILKINNF